MFALALCLIAVETVGLALEEAEGVPLETAWSVRDLIARGLERNTHARVRVTDVDAEHFMTRETCVAHVLASTGASSVVLLRLFAGVTRIRVAAQHLGPMTTFGDEVAEVADLMQVGSRNMANSALLAELGRQRKPVLIKRGFAATLREFLLAAEYVLAGGNERVIL